MSRILAVLLVTVFALSTGACATGVEGASQDISVQTIPSGATCNMKRNGLSIGMIESTPGMVHVSKESTPIELTCTKEAHLAATECLQASFGGTTLGNILMGGVSVW